MTVRVGSILYGFCGGAFGRDSYHDKRVEAIGADWLVARPLGWHGNEPVELFTGNPEELEQYLHPQEQTFDMEPDYMGRFERPWPDQD